MSFTVVNTVKEVAIKMPGATRVFEKLGIDYCCGGNRTLKEACHQANVSIDEVLSSLIENDRTSQPESSQDWQKETLTALANYILQTHHVFTRDELARLENLLNKVCSVHGQNHPELVRLNEIFTLLKDDLIPHMLKEEGVLFPYVKAIETATANHQTKPMPFFGTVQNPVRMMMMEHDNAGELLRIMRTMTDNYTVPADACASFKALYEALAAFEADLHQHIHLENNILFPRTIALESGY